jgi:hypothetical protein
VNPQASDHVGRSVQILQAGDLYRFSYLAIVVALRADA